MKKEEERKLAIQKEEQRLLELRKQEEERLERLRREEEERRIAQRAEEEAQRKLAIQQEEERRQAQRAQEELERKLAQQKVNHQPHSPHKKVCSRGQKLLSFVFLGTLAVSGLQVYSADARRVAFVVFMFSPILGGTETVGVTKTRRRKNGKTKERRRGKKSCSKSRR